jgi:malonyl-CoA/methylmalonyl-CoA synthetase
MRLQSLPARELIRKETDRGMSHQAMSDRFANSFSTHAPKPAVSFFRDGRLESEITYSRLSRDSNRIANAFASMGVAKGDRVILYFEKSLVFVVAHLALLKLGAIVVPMNPGFKVSEMHYFIGDAEPALILYGPEQETVMKTIGAGRKLLRIGTDRPYDDLEFFNAASEASPGVDIGLEDPGVIIYTSGTTGKPTRTPVAAGRRPCLFRLHGGAPHVHNDDGAAGGEENRFFPHAAVDLGISPSGGQGL